MGESVRLKSQLSRSPIAPREVSNQLKGPEAAIVVIVGFLIGSVTPPVGVAYFTAATIAQVRLEKVAIALIPYLVGLFVLLFLILVIPGLTMFLPNLMSN